MHQMVQNVIPTINASTTAVGSTILPLQNNLTRLTRLLFCFFANCYRKRHVRWCRSALQFPRSLCAQSTNDHLRPRLYVNLKFGNPKPRLIDVLNLPVKCSTHGETGSCEKPKAQVAFTTNNTMNAKAAAAVNPDSLATPCDDAPVTNGSALSNAKRHKRRLPEVQARQVQAADLRLKAA